MIILEKWYKIKKWWNTKYARKSGCAVIALKGARKELTLTVRITKKLWKILQEMGIPDHLTCLLRNLYAGQEATVRTKHGTADWFQIGKGVCQGCILPSCFLNLYAEYVMWNAGLNEAQAGVKIYGRNINNLRYAYHPYGRKWRRTKEPLVKWKRRVKKLA